MEDQRTGKQGSRSKGIPGIFLMVSLLITVAACEKGMRNMYNQPRHPPYDASRLFTDGQASRPTMEGTVAHAGGMLAGTSSGRLGQVLPEAGSIPADNPYPVSGNLLQRGRQRYNIYCVPCHGLVGDGDGILPRRGYPAPPTYHSDRLRKVPDSHIYSAMTNGFGVMFSYASRVSPPDRWAIVAYIRALQLSQHAGLEDVPVQERTRLLQGKSP